MTHDAKLRLQEIQLRIAHNLHTGKMHYAGWRLAWDETSELVSLNAVAGKSTRSQQGSSWQVCVCHVTFFWGDLDGAQFFSCVTPPLPLLSNGAQHLDNALCGHPLMMPIQKFKQWMTEYAEFFFSLHEADAHPANDRLHHFWREDESTDEKPSLSSLVNCMNHQTNLVVVSSVHIICNNTVNSMYTATRFLKMSGHFLRLIAVVRHDGGDTELKNNNIEQ